MLATLRANDTSMELSPESGPAPPASSPDDTQTTLFSCHRYADESSKNVLPVPLEDCSSAQLPIQPGNLPPRVVVRNPDGNIVLGEDSKRLVNERSHARIKQESQNAAALEPGGERWWFAAYNQYWQVLHISLSSRKRLMFSPLGVDMGAMLWPILCVISRTYNLGIGGQETLPSWAVLSLSGTCIMLDVATLLACSQDSSMVLAIIIMAHVPLYASMFASHLSYNLWILTKVLVILFSVRVLAVLREINWMQSGPQDALPVPTGICAKVNTWLLSRESQRLRANFIAALGQARNPLDTAPSGSSTGSTSFHIGAVARDGSVVSAESQRLDSEDLDGEIHLQVMPDSGILVNDSADPETTTSGTIE